MVVLLGVHLSTAMEHLVQIPTSAQRVCEEFLVFLYCFDSFWWNAIRAWCIDSLQPLYSVSNLCSLRFAGIDGKWMRSWWISAGSVGGATLED